MDDAQKAKERFLDTMHEDALKVRPKWQFTLRTIFLVTGIFLAALFLLYLVSFIIFVLHQTGTWFGPRFGGPGWFALFKSLPWLLILFCVIFGAALFLLVERYSFVYERPVVYIVFGIVVTSLLGGVLLSQTSLHQKLLNDAEHNELPAPMDGFYTDYGAPPPPSAEIRRGIVIATTTDGFVMEDTNDETSTVIGYQVPIGSDVVVFGERTSGGIIQATGIEVI
jgi:hypothetical protein